MIVVADTGPLNYLILIEAVDLLKPLYERVVIPQTVASEMKAPGSPASVSGWISSAPAWLEVVPDPAVDGILADLDPGERAAIATAVLLNASRILVDDFAGRAEGGTASLESDWHSGGYRSRPSPRSPGLRRGNFTPFQNQLLYVSWALGSGAPTACDRGLNLTLLQILLKIWVEQRFDLRLI